MGCRRLTISANLTEVRAPSIQDLYLALVRRHPGWAVAALLLPAILFIAQARRFGHWLIDDALITFAYARTLTEGGGMAQAVGEPPIEGISNPLWMLVLAGLRLLGLFDRGRSWFGVEDYVVTIRALALLLFLGTMIMIRLMARALLSARGADGAMLLAGLVLAMTPPYVIWAISGLENPLYGFGAAALTAVVGRAVANGTLLSRPTAVLAGVISLLVALTRPDGLLFAAVYPLTVLILMRTGRMARPIGCAALSAVTFLLPAGLLLLWRYRVFGLWVPHTAVAKGQSGMPPDWPLRFSELAASSGGWLPAFGVVAATLAVVVSRRAGRSLTAVIPMIIALVLAAVAYVGLRHDWMGELRFATPLMVMAGALLGISVAVVLSRAIEPGRVGMTGKIITLALTVAVFAVYVVQMLPRLDAFAAEPTVPGCRIVDRVGRRFNHYGDVLGISSGTVVAPDIGGLLLTSRYRVVDLAGLTEPTIGRLRAERDPEGIRDYLLESVRPTFVQVHGPWITGLPWDPRFKRDYVAIAKGQDFVRRDAVSSGADLARLQQEDRQETRQDDRLIEDALKIRPRAGCGPLIP